MRWSFRVARVRETEVRIHVTLLLLLAWYGWRGWRVAGGHGAAEELAFVVLVFLSILLHEFGHVAAARRYGIATPDVTLTPIGGVARLADFPREPRQELVIALGGPLVTLVIALLIAGALAMGPGLVSPDAPGAPGFWSQLAWTNGFLLAFNLLPAFPLDGGRVFRALLAMKLGLLRGTRVAVLAGQAFAAVALMAVLAYDFDPILLLIAVFVWAAGGAEYEDVRRRTMLEQVGPATPRDAVAAVPPDFPLRLAAEVMLRDDVQALPVLDEARRFHGLLTRDDVLRAAVGGEFHGVVRAALPPSAETERLVVGMPQDAMAERLLASGRQALPLLDEGGQLVGIVTRELLHDAALLERLRSRSAPPT